KTREITPWVTVWSVASATSLKRVERTFAPSRKIGVLLTTTARTTTARMTCPNRLITSGLTNTTGNNDATTTTHAPITVRLPETAMPIPSATPDAAKSQVRYCPGRNITQTP